MPSAHHDTLYAAPVAERRRLITVLEGLTPRDWDRAALCDGWRVREVVATSAWPPVLGPGRDPRRPRSARQLQPLRRPRSPTRRHADGRR